MPASWLCLSLVLAGAPPSPADATVAGQDEQLLPPDEAEMAPDDLFGEEPVPETEPSRETPAEPSEPSETQAPSPGEDALDADALDADALEADALGLGEEDPEGPAPADSVAPAPPAEPEVVVAPQAPPRTLEELSTAATIGLVGCGALTLVAAGIGLIANPIVAALLVFNAFAPAVIIPACGGSLVVSQTLASAGAWALCVSTPVPVIASVGSGAVATGAQLAVSDPWVPMAAAAAAVIPGVLVSLVGAGIIVGGTTYALSAQHVSLQRLGEGKSEGLYLNIPRAITGALIAMGGAVVGVAAAPIAGGLAAAVGYTVAGTTEAGASSPAPEGEAPVAASSSRNEVSF